ncbi:hypothetical protein CCZ01_04850 [Helicobacter monodelphidis]|uniref:MnmC family methyltransferase n=1 Tax=Helicobacter sp. 15-1451 TaxID=2004995 RepID=UPI000DCF5E6E|nr:MnmC family methyltransferase [Helicobacter sp. 15-1451]RAX57778.1 hypothetical protein CCZ01_04850 [Helicobacter sp. 15-1451]
MYRPVIGGDFSYTLFNEAYAESYHCITEGALSETLRKHIRPPIDLKEDLLYLPVVRIIDICFGLGYNTLCSVLEYTKLNFAGKVQIFTPEKDFELLKRLPTIPYPDDLKPFLFILETLLQKRRFISDKIDIQLYCGDAIEYLGGLIDCFAGKIDIIHQDPFSPKKNPELWNMKHFHILAKLLKPNGIITTYSQASNVYYTAFLNGFYSYKIFHLDASHKPSSCLTLRPIENFKQRRIKPIDINHKLRINPYLKEIL